MATKNDNLKFLTAFELEQVKQEEKRSEENFIAAKKFYENKTPVHLLKRDRQFWNGVIVEFSHDFFIIDERKLGRRIVFFIELYSIEKLEAKE